MTTLSNDLIVDHPRPPVRRWQDIQLPLGLTWTSVALGLIVLLAAALRLYNLQAVGNANEYYTAAVKSMLQSFSNFFFAAAEPGGSVTVDKPPLGLWLQAISAMIFGVNGVAVVFPQVFAGILSVPLLFRLARRYFGDAAGLIAALVLAVTPVSIAVERNNTMDATLIFTLLLAAWAYIRATDTGKLRYLILGGVLVGLGFNIKMMQAFLPLPAFYALYLFGARVGWRRKALQLAASTLVLLAVAFSWATVVQLTPADQRPYIGSTQTNNVFDLIFGYNGVNRLLGGQGTPGGGPGGAPNGTQNGLQGSPQDGSQNGAMPQTAMGPQNGFPPPQGAQGEMFNTGQAGVLRLVTAPLGNEVGWLLPLGILSIGLLLVGARLRFPLNENHQAAVLWGGWLVTSAVFFSIASFFHPYYLSMLSVPLAALVGIGVVRLWDLRHLRQNRLLLMSLLRLAISGGILAFQIDIARQYVSNLVWAIPAVIALGMGGILLIMRRQATRFAAVGFACLVIGMIWVPTLWSTMTTLQSNNSPLPEAYSGSSNPMGLGGPGFRITDQRMRGSSTGDPEQAALADSDNSMDTVTRNQQADGMGRPGDMVNSKLLAYLAANTKDVEYLVAVPSSQQGASLVLATGRPVLYMGGFNGGDPVVDATKMARLVAENRVRYVLQGGGGAPGNNKSDLTAWLQSNCKTVSEFSSSATNGAGSNIAMGGPGGPGMQGTTLYECSVQTSAT